MANMKNAKKAIRVISRKKESNRRFEASCKTAMRNLEKAIVAKDKDKALENLRIAIKRLDKAASKGVVTKNFVARNKSRLTRKVNVLD